MQELRLVGVHEDGEHLLLSGEDGGTYQLPINEALRMAGVRQLTPRSVSVPTPPETAPAVHLTPRDIQSRIRNGATAQDVVDESGMALAHVLRYEGPVRAERDYMAQLAQRVEVASPPRNHDGYRSAFGDEPAGLGEMVAFRVQAYGVDSSSVEWDAWRRADGMWDVVARFTLKDETTASIGEEPPAQWTFNPVRKTILNANRWAQLLSELEPLDGPLPARRLSAVTDRVFDFEEQKDDESQGEDAPEQSSDSENLLDVLRSRRGQRLGSDEDGDDALALMLSKGNIPAAHPRDGEPAAEGPEDVQPAFQGLSLAPSHRPSVNSDTNSDSYSDGAPQLLDGVSTNTREISIFARPSRPAANPGSSRPVQRQEENVARSGSEDHRGHGGGRGAGQSEPKPEQADRKIKPKRSSVPSWDDIVFGTKGD